MATISFKAAPKKRRVNPEITLMKLAEYAFATPARRTAIIKAFIDDDPFRRNRYYDVRPVLSRYVKNSYDADVINNEITRINGLPITSSWTKDNQKNSVESLRAVLASSLPDLTNYSIVPYTPRLEHIKINNVKVVIKPELYMQNDKTGKVGAIKFNIAKTRSYWLKEEALEHAATLLKYAYSEYGHDEDDIDYKGCFAIDVFSKSHASSPRAYKRALNTMEHCCQEISDRWNSL